MWAAGGDNEFATVLRRFAKPTIAVATSLLFLGRHGMPMLQPVAPIVVVDEAQAFYGARTALAGLSMELYGGELLGLLGPNGAGKTTLIKCLGGLRRLDKGSIRFPEAEQAQPQRWLKRRAEQLDRRRLAEYIGLVPQEIALYADLTVRQNLEVFARYHGLRGEAMRESISHALHWASLDQRAGSLVASLSGGMQRRLNIACSTLHQPRVLLLDEPTVGIDPQSRERIYEMLESLLEQGTAILLTTHQLEEAQHRCDRIVIVDAGRVIASGTFEELIGNVYQQPRQLSIRFATPLASVPQPLVLDDTGLEAVGMLTDDRDLPRMLAHLVAHHAVIDQVTFREPPLQQLFLALTGKELRE